jgi:hypothetical protein
MIIMNFHKELKDLLQNMNHIYQDHGNLKFKKSMFIKFCGILF